MKNWKLELLRGSASLLVFFDHLILNNNNLNKISYLNILSNWGTEAVIIFFILSGTVINISQIQKPKSSISFLKNRLFRIYPLYFIGILLSAIVPIIIHTGTINPQILFGNLFFFGTLQGYIVQVPFCNPVVWSLTFEMFFYLLYGLTIGKYQSKLIKFWLAISLVAIPFYYLNFTGILGFIITLFSFSSIWLIGYFIAQYKDHFKIKSISVAIISVSLLPAISRLHLSNEYYDISKFLIFALVASPFFLFCLKRNKIVTNKKIVIINIYQALVVMFFVFVALIYFSNSFIVSKLLYISFPFLLLGINFFISNKLISFIKKGALFLGSISYSIYIIHFPILVLVNYYFGNSYILYLIICISTVLFISYILEFKYQYFVISVFYKKLENSSVSLLKNKKAC